jgi:hypothetical protein
VEERDVCPLTHQQRRNGRKSNFATHLAVGFPRLDDHAWSGLTTRSEYATIDIYVLSFAFRRDRLERDCGRNGHERRRLKLKEGEGVRRRRGLFGAPSVKNGSRTLLSVAFPTGGMLSASTAAEWPRKSERKTNSCQRVGGTGVARAGEN